MPFVTIYRLQAYMTTLTFTQSHNTISLLSKFWCGEIEISWGILPGTMPRIITDPSAVKFSQWEGRIAHSKWPFNMVRFQHCPVYPRMEGICVCLPSRGVTEDENKTGVPPKNGTAWSVDYVFRTSLTRLQTDSMTVV